MRFGPGVFAVGGKVLIPDSFVNPEDEGTIEEVRHAGIIVVWGKDLHKQTAYYSYDWLNQMYNKNKLDDNIPF